MNDGCSADVFEAPAVFGDAGELVLVRVSVEPRQLEDLLEVLAGLEFPVNPELRHRTGHVLVDFPAYRGHVREIRDTLERYGFEPRDLNVFRVLAAPLAASA